jgi:hypothetical protein
VESEAGMINGEETWRDDENSDFVNIPMDGVVINQESASQNCVYSQSETLRISRTSPAIVDDR